MLIPHASLLQCRRLNGCQTIKEHQLLKQIQRIRAVVSILGLNHFQIKKLTYLWQVVSAEFDSIDRRSMQTNRRSDIVQDPQTLACVAGGVGPCTEGTHLLSLLVCLSVKVQHVYCSKQCHACSTLTVLKLCQTSWTGALHLNTSTLDTRAQSLHKSKRSYQHRSISVATGRLQFPAAFKDWCAGLTGLHQGYSKINIGLFKLPECTRPDVALALPASVLRHLVGIPAGDGLFGAAGAAVLANLLLEHMYR